jgi:outer membrane lipoprotein SlyB
VTGTLVRLTGDTVEMMPGGVFALNEGRQLEHFVGSRGHGGKGATVGAVLGALTGAVIGAATWQPCTETGFLACFMYPSQEVQAAGGAALGALGGALVGFVIGKTVRSESWRSVPTGIVSADGPAAASQGSRVRPATEFRITLTRFCSA